MGNEEIKVNSEEIQKTVGKLKEIQTGLKKYSQQKLLMDESKGKTAEQIKNMYIEVVSVVKAMENLVGQTITLIENGDKKFKLADKQASRRFFQEK